MNKKSFYVLWEGNLIDKFGFWGTNQSARYGPFDEETARNKAEKAVGVYGGQAKLLEVKGTYSVNKPQPEFVWN